MVLHAATEAQSYATALAAIHVLEAQAHHVLAVPVVVVVQSNAMEVAQVLTQLQEITTSLAAPATGGE